MDKDYKGKSMKNSRPVYREYLIKLKKQAGIKTEELAEKVYLNKKSYYGLEGGTRGHRMSANLFLRLASELKVDVETLIRLEADYQIERMKKGLISVPWYVDDGDDHENKK